MYHRTDDPADGVIVISGRTEGSARDIPPESGMPDLDHTAIVCAVPYLRDKDVRSVEPGETIDDPKKSGRRYYRRKNRHGF